ncbi:hypothetical protein OH807_06210 [Kitasatospora sp. NBC_01560]|uniref:hypothetical protein n=1 Tax=Kitasatospora sp. NBC_01560 TaxID=2975965 RepID=UPI00386FB94D
MAFAAQAARHVSLPALTTLSMGLGPLLVFLCASGRPKRARKKKARRKKKANHGRKPGQ